MLRQNIYFIKPQQPPPTPPKTYLHKSNNCADHLAKTQTSFTDTGCSHSLAWLPLGQLEKHTYRTSDSQLMQDT